MGPNEFQMSKPSQMFEVDQLVNKAMNKRAEQARLDLVLWYTLSYQNTNN